jgi:hypothetical protein
MLNREGGDTFGNHGSLPCRVSILDGGFAVIQEMVITFNVCSTWFQVFGTITWLPKSPFSTSTPCTHAGRLRNLSRHHHAPAQGRFNLTQKVFVDPCKIKKKEKKKQCRLLACKY